MRKQVANVVSNADDTCYGKLVFISSVAIYTLIVIGSFIIAILSYVKLVRIYWVSDWIIILISIFVTLGLLIITFGLIAYEVAKRKRLDEIDK